MFNVTQDQNNPLLHPYKSNKWENVSACNGCPITDKNKTYIVYRAISTPDMVRAPNLHKSVIGIATQKNHCTFTDRKKYITPEEEWEAFGCEDPRITKIENKFYTFYTALSSPDLGPDAIKVAVGISDNLNEVTEKHLVTPFNAKAMAMFPEKINDEYHAILTVNTDMPPAKIAIAKFKKIEDFWDHKKWNKWYENLDKHSIELKRNDSDLTEVGAPPVKTKDGWLVIYSHIQNYFSENERTFGIEAVLLDLHNPKKIIGRTEFPIIVPDQIYTKYGFVSDVSFPTGAVINGKNLDIYYGAADTTTCKASLQLDLLLNELKSETKKQLLVRHAGNPILKPIPENQWENKNIFNPAAVDLNKKVRILYRAQSDTGVSTIGYAESADGVNIDYRMDEPCYVPRMDFEKPKGDGYMFSGCEDPRVALIGKNVYMTYTAYNGIDAPNIAISHIAKKDLANKKFKWSEPVIISPEGHDDKDACVLPKKFKKGYFVIHRINSRVTGDYVNDLHFTKHEIDTSIDILEPRRGMWDGQKVGLASTPHLTKKGWLIFYHGVSAGNVYNLGVALLDKNDPTKVLGRSALPILQPETDYEKFGEVNNVVFPCGSVIRKDNVYIYYGAADRVVGVATGSLKALLQSVC